VPSRLPLAIFYHHRPDATTLEHRDAYSTNRYGLWRYTVLSSLDN
jgi:hypothetical protein